MQTAGYNGAHTHIISKLYEHFFPVLFTGFSQTLNNANACKGGSTTQ